MADATPTKATGAPTRARKPVPSKTATAAKAAAPKAPQKAAAAPKPTRATTKAKAAAAPVVEETTAPPKDADGREKVLVEFEYANTTKSYDVFKPVEESGVKGSLYVPHGTEEVRGLLFIAADEE